MANGYAPVLSAAAIAVLSQLDSFDVISSCTVLSRTCLPARTRNNGPASIFAELPSMFWLRHLLGTVVIHMCNPVIQTRFFSSRRLLLVNAWM